MTENLETRRKRLYMRSIRRGIKEMDILLTNFADAQLADLTVAELDTYEQFLSENDHDLYAWVTEAQPGPEQYAALLERINDAAKHLKFG